MDVALLTASLAILVWMCAQFAFLSRRQRMLVRQAAERVAPAATGTPPAQLAVVDQAPAE